MKKYAFWVKCVTFALCVLLALCVAVSGLGLLMAGSMGMYRYSSYEQWRNAQFYNTAEQITYYIMRDLGAELSGSPQWLLEQTGYAYAIEEMESWYELSENDWCYIVEDANGKILRNTQNSNVKDMVLFSFENRYAEYPVIVGYRNPVPETAVPTEAASETSYAVDETQIQAVTTPALSTAPDIEYAESYWDPNTEEEALVAYEFSGAYMITVGISKNYTGFFNSGNLPENTIRLLFSSIYPLVVIIAVSFALFAAAFVFLMTIAGRDPRTGEANPKAMNRIPLDLYLAAGVFGTSLGCLFAFELLEILIYENSNYNIPVILLMCVCGIAVATLDVGFFTALAAQFKAPGGFWWRNSICGRILKLAGGVFCKGFRLFRRAVSKLFAMLPVIWKWIAVGGILGMVLLIICAGSASFWYSVFPLAVWCLVFAAVVIYCGYSYGVLAKGIQRMKDGDLNEKISTEWLYGSFKTIGEDLNTLADVVTIAAEKQMKSERMKTELVTNVSHDIKTPLTSVINYVDLLQQPHTEEEGKQYLEVLSRQSLRLKKLVDDLMDMSKASSGNMAVNITSVNAVETVNQALGEFADKLDAAQLTPVFRTPDSQLYMKADGRLTWRVLSNLLSNVVKYALPGTRVYLDLLRLDKTAVLSVKNISREELNISAEELTERFVRGDTSRNTEGSGLGLNIAQSLMRLQGGNMELTVDGDLFKVTLTFPVE